MDRIRIESLQSDGATQTLFIGVDRADGWIDFGGNGSIGGDSIMIGHGVASIVSEIDCDDLC